MLQAIPYHLESMDFGSEIDGTQDFFQMFWPIIVSHKIDEESPLWEISARDLTSKMQFEVVLTMEGITPETGNTIQVSSNIAKIFKYLSERGMREIVGYLEKHFTSLSHSIHFFMCNKGCIYFVIDILNVIIHFSF